MRPRTSRAGGIAVKFPVSDELLVHRAAAGRWEDFEPLLRRCRNRVYRTCFRMVGIAEDAKDGAVRSLVRAYRASAVARFLSSRWSLTRSRKISARRIPTLDLSRLG